MIQLTEQAAQEIKKIFTDNSYPETACFRIAIIGRNVERPLFVVEDRPGKAYKVLESLGIKIAVHPISFRHLDGTTIDFSKDVEGGFFVRK